MMGESNDPCYYRIYLNRADMVCVLELQSFDEYDYINSRFFRDSCGDRLRFEDEGEARKFVNRTFKREVIDKPDRLGRDDQVSPFNIPDGATGLGIPEPDED
jgi:hypothetical protein